MLPLATLCQRQHDDILPVLTELIGGHVTISSPNKEKRIVVRVDPKTWEDYDNKRHAERRSFQELGEDLLRAWYAGAGVATHDQTEPIERQSPPPAQTKYAGLPKEVASLFQQHWADARLQACIGALAELFALDDDGAIDSLVANCETFRRGARATAALRKIEEIQAPGTDKDGDAERIKELLDAQSRIAKEALLATETGRNIEGGRTRRRQVGSATIRKVGKGGEK